MTSRRQTMTLAHATETFVRGHAFGKSLTHPYLAERVESVWVMRDAPRSRGAYRGEEWVSSDVAPSELDQVARRHTRGGYAICAIRGADESQTPIREAFKALGYRLGATEAFMHHDLGDVPVFDADVSIERVLTAERAAQLAKQARARQILPEHLAPDAPIRQYVALQSNEIVGWVRSIVVDKATWCSNLYVRPEFRRRGIALALMSRLLHDDRAHAAQDAVLLASHAGANLYPLLGYRRIGMLFLFLPVRGKS